MVNKVSEKVCGEEFNHLKVNVMFFVIPFVIAFALFAFSGNFIGGAIQSEVPRPKRRR